MSTTSVQGHRHLTFVGFLTKYPITRTFLRLPHCLHIPTLPLHPFLRVRLAHDRPSGRISCRSLWFPEGRSSSVVSSILELPINVTVLAMERLKSPVFLPSYLQHRRFVAIPDSNHAVAAPRACMMFYLLHRLAPNLLSTSRCNLRS